MRNIRTNDIVTYKGNTNSFLTYNKRYKIEDIVYKDSDDEYWIVDDTDCRVYFTENETGVLLFKTLYELRKQKLEKLDEKEFL